MATQPSSPLSSNIQSYTQPTNMPRQSRSSRPAARSTPASSAPSGSRGAHTAAYPAQHAPAPAAGMAGTQQRQPGMLAQAASTMGGAMGG